MKLSATKWSHRCEIQRQHACLFGWGLTGLLPVQGP